MALAAAALPGVFNPVTRDNSAMINAPIFGNLYLNTNGTVAEVDFETRFISALKECTPANDLEDLIESDGIHIPGTCEWFVSSSQFDVWSHTVTSSVLWAPGRPGVGKTFMSVYLVKTLQLKYSQQRDWRLLYFFCKHHDLRKNTAIAVIRSLLSQIIQYQPGLLKIFLNDYMAFKDVNSVLQNKDILWRLFHRIYMKSSAQAVFCVLDALDECEEERDWLVEKLASLRAVVRPTFKLLVTSRGVPESTRLLLEPCALVNLNPETNKHVETDLRTFINASSEVLSRQKRYTSDIEEKIRHSLTQRAGGTFLWVSCALKMLRSAPASEADEIVRSLPRELDGHFSRMISLIDPDKSSMCANILKWVATAFRPLTIKELAVATCVTSTWGIDPIQKMRDRIEYCGGMLKVVGHEVQFIHETAKSYLTGRLSEKDLAQHAFHISTQQADLDLCLFCIRYLQQGSLDDGDLDLYELGQSPGETSRNNQYPLLAYCVRYWPLHARRASSRVEGLRDALEEWSRTKSRSWNAWLKTYWRSEFKGWEIPKKMSLLHLSSFFGIDSLILAILSDEKRKSSKQLHSSLEEKSIYDMTALHWAAGNGHQEAVELLLDYGANISAKGDFFTPLCWAVRNGHTGVAEVLVKRGAPLEQKSWGATPLCWAAWAGKDDILQLLLSKPFDPDAHTVPSSIQALNLYNQSTRKESELRWLSLDEARKVNHAAERVEAEEMARSSADLLKLMILFSVAYGFLAFLYGEVIFRLCIVQARDHSWLQARHGTMYGQDVSWAVLTFKGRVRHLRDLLLEPRTVISVARTTMQERPWNTLLTATLMSATFAYAFTVSGMELICYWLVILLTELLTIHLIQYLGNFEIPLYLFFIQTSGFWMGSLPGISRFTWRIGTVVWYAVVCLTFWTGLVNTAFAASALPFLIWSIGSLIIGQQAGAGSGDTALHLAAGRGNVSCVRRLLAYNYAQYSTNRDGLTPIQLALRYGHLECVRAMLGPLAAAVLPEIGDLPLYQTAAVCGDLEVMAYLDDRGLGTYDSLTQIHPAQCAAAAGQLKVLQYLTQLDKIETSVGSLTPLHLAANNGHLECCSFLLNEGFPVDIRASHGRTPLHWSVDKGRIDVVKLLLEAGADPKSVDSFNITPLHKAVLVGSREIAEVVISYGARLDALDNLRQTPLMVAAKSGHTTLVELLVAHGAEVNLKNTTALSALAMAVIHGHLGCVNHLLIHGANVNDRFGNGDTALHFAVYKYSQGILESILEAGGNPLLHNSFGQTPFDWASDYPNLVEIMQPRYPTLKQTDKAQIEAAVSQHIIKEAVSLREESIIQRDFMHLIFLMRQLRWWQSIQTVWRWIKTKDSVSGSLFCTGCTKALLAHDIFMCFICYDFTLCNNCMLKYNDGNLKKYLCQNHDFCHIPATASNDELLDGDDVMQFYQDEWLDGLIRWCNDRLAKNNDTNVHVHVHVTDAESQEA